MIRKPDSVWMTETWNLDTALSNDQSRLFLNILHRLKLARKSHFRLCYEVNIFLYEKLKTKLMAVHNISKSPTQMLTLVVQNYQPPSSQSSLFKKSVLFSCFRFPAISSSTTTWALRTSLSGRWTWSSTTASTTLSDSRAQAPTPHCKLTTTKCRPNTQEVTINKNDIS